ncbi:MAG: GNAT family N-acetyltransferase [Calditrichaceae bacterium]
MTILETERLALRELTVEDAPFILELVNDPSWLRYIGDKGVRTLDDARDYILNGPVQSYKQFGFGLYLVGLKDSGIPIGMCGLIKRDYLTDVDIGFAFMPAFTGKGYATESASTLLTYGKDVFGLERIVAITTRDNDKSIKVLEKLGMRFEKMISLPGDGAELKLYAPADNVEDKVGSRK